MIGGIAQVKIVLISRGKFPDSSGWKPVLRGLFVHHVVVVLLQSAFIALRCNTGSFTRRIALRRVVVW